MAQLPQSANTQENNSTGGFDVVPEGEYVVAVTKSEWRNAKSNPDNKMIYMEITIQEGEHKGQKLFERLNLINSNPVAVKIANQTMNKICTACLLSDVEDTEELHGIPMTAVVEINENEGTDFPPQNVIKNYSPVDGEEFVAPWD